MNKYQNEIHKIFEGVSDSLGEILEEEKVIIAGGIISRVFSGRKTKDADVDVYFRSKESLARVLYGIEGTGNIVVDWTDKSIMIKSGKDGCIVQFVIIDYFEDAYKIFEKFDFTCVMGAYDFGLGEGGEFVFHEDFMIHNGQRKLVYNSKTDFPIISALRINKYEKEGYKISKNEFVKVLLSIMNLNISSWEDAEKQFGKFYGTSLSGMITDELKKESFSLENLLNVVESHTFENVSSPPSNKIIDDWQTFVIGITGLKKNAYKWKDYYYSMKDDGIFGRVLKTENYNLIDEHNVFNCDFSKVYKYVVKKENGKLVSQYKESFEYKIGEIAKDLSYGLWFYYLPGLINAKRNYGNNSNRVLIECELVKIKKEANDPGSDGQAFEILPLRIIEKEEEEKMLSAYKENAFNEYFPF